MLRRRLQLNFPRQASASRWRRPRTVIGIWSSASNRHQPRTRPTSSRSACTASRWAGILGAFAAAWIKQECLLPAHAGLVYLQGRCPEPALDMTLPEGFGTRHRPLIWNVEEDGADATLMAVASGQASWGMLFWVPLMARGEDAALLARWKDLASAVEDRRRRGDLGKIALVFAELAGRFVAWEKALEGFDMTESKVVNSWIEDAVRERDLDNARRFLLRLLNKRFPCQVPPDVVEAINAQPSLPMLEDWFDSASQIGSMAEFIRLLRA